MVKFLQMIRCTAGSFLGDAVVSPATGWGAVGDWLVGFLANFGIRLIELVAKIVMTVINFVLLFIDFMFAFIREVVGINGSFDRLAGDLENSDILFKFIFADNVQSTLRFIIIMAVVMIIIFCVLAIIKTEYVSATTGAPNTKKQVLVSTLKSLLMMAIVPMIFIGGIIFSNAILRSLDNITSGGESTSFANQIFYASTYQANAYRNYAEQNMRIPITYNFEEVDTEGFFDHATEGTVAELEASFKAFSEKSGWDRGFTTYLMFHNFDFVDSNYVETADDVAFKNGSSVGSGYHSVYDEGLFFRNIEYHVMADVVDFAMQEGETVYFKTPQDIIASWDIYGHGSMPEVYQNFFTPGNDAKGSYISFSIAYSDRDVPVVYKSYTSSNSVQDEAKGSVFLACTRDEARNVFVPLVDGLNFSTSYASGQNLVVARGIFDDGNPTAIREEGNQIKFYRDKLNIPYLLDILPKISYEMPEGGVTEIGNGWIGKALKGGFKAVTGFDLNDFIPYIYFNFDVLRLFDKSYITLASFDDGGFKLNFMFTGDVAFSHFYNYKDVNLIILVFVSCIIFGMLFKVMFGALARIFDLVLLFVTYPAVCATISIDNGTRFTNWVQHTISTVLSIYGVIVGLNLILMLYPIIESIKIFTAADFMSLLASNLVPSTWTANFMNLLVSFLMTFALFGLFNTIIQMLNQLADPKNYKTGDSTDLISRGDDTIKTTKSIIKNTGDFISGKKLLDTIDTVKDSAIGFIPGSAFVKEGIDKVKFNKKQSTIANERNDLAAKMRGGNEAQIIAQTKRVEKSIK